MRSDFYKLYFGVSKYRPPGQLYIFYNRRPLYRPAFFDKDRYRFVLPRGLEEKMLAGELIADFSYTELPLDMSKVKRSPTPCSIILSERYE